MVAYFPRFKRGLINHAKDEIDNCKEKEFMQVWMLLLDEVSSLYLDNALNDVQSTRKTSDL